MTDESPVPADGADQTPAPQRAEQPTADAVPPLPSAPRVRWQDRVLRLPAVIGVALATLIMGGLGGAAVGALADDRDQRGGWGERHERMGGWGPGHRGPEGGPGYGPGPRQQGPAGGGPQQQGPNTLPSPDQSGSS